MSLARYRKIFKNGIEVIPLRDSCPENMNPNEEKENQEEHILNDSE